jgi:dihydroneopterin aldolase
MSTSDKAQPVKIELRGVSVHTRHGVSVAEREVGQRMIFDVDLNLDSCLATVNDELEGTVDYGEATAVLLEAATERSYLTLERLVTVIAGRLLEMSGAGSVRVRATKPEPPIPVVMDGASVEVTLSGESAPADGE